MLWGWTRDVEVHELDPIGGRRLAVGAWIEFTCGACDYEAMVSGRDDAGFAASTTTIVCEDCEELYDVVTLRLPRGGAEGLDPKPIEPKCPKSGRHTVGRWEHPGACPKCGHEMGIGEKITMWD